MPNIQISANTVRPDYPADTNSLSQYFSHVKSWARDRGAENYVPPTRTHFEKFERDFLSRSRGYSRRQREMIMASLDIDTTDFSTARGSLGSLSYSQISTINTYALNECIMRPTRAFSGRTFTYGSLGVLIVQHALNVYASVRAITVPPTDRRRNYYTHHKISFICTQSSTHGNMMDRAFHNRCVLYLKESMIKDTLQVLKTSFDNQDWATFWNHIAGIYDSCCSYHLVTRDSRPSVVNGQDAATEANNQLRQAPTPRTTRPIERGGFRGTPPVQVVTPQRDDRINSDDYCRHLRQEYFGRDREQDTELGVDFIAGVVGMNYRNMPQNIQDALKESLLKHLKPAYELVMGELIGVEVSSEEGD